MADTVSQISYAMSLRTPQKEALSVLDRIASQCDFRDGKVSAESAASAVCGKEVTINKHLEFPSFCYHMATGIGKTRLMGASIYYLYKTKGYRHFFILAPGSTIYDKLRKESNPNHPKYIFKGLESEMGRPQVFDGENYTNYLVGGYEQMRMNIDKTSGIQLFIFNIGKIFNSRTDSQFNFHKFRETLGAAFSDILAGFDDLVVCMDEAHRYYAPASMQAINYLKPVLGLEFTATPKDTGNVIYAYDVARGAKEGFLKRPVVAGRKNLAGYSDDDIEEMKIRDGLNMHEHRKTVLKQYCSDNNLPYLKPIVLIACKDTTHAGKIRAFIDSDTFENGRYRGKVIEIRSNMKGEETDENVRLLLSIESSQNPVEIVLHVYKLKEGWDVNNLFTIIPLNAAKSDILAMQTIGRGLRLPFGIATGNEEIDTLDIVAHEHYRALVDEIDKKKDLFRFRDLDEAFPEPTDAVDVNSPVEDAQLDLFEQAMAASGITTFTQVDSPKTQDDLYSSYLKTFGETRQKRGKNAPTQDQISIFDTTGTDAASTPIVEDPIATALATDTTADTKAPQKPMPKSQFISTIKEYSAKAISVPQILIQTNSTVAFRPFAVRRTIKDFEVAMTTIERYDAVNRQLLSSVDAQILEVDNAMNTLACLLLDEISELSYDDADFIMNIVSQYLDQLDGDEEQKRRIVRRYASLIISDIKRQIFEHVDRKTWTVHTIQKDLILFRKFVKSVKKDGKVRFDSAFNDRTNIRKYLFTGYRKSYYPENGFDSDTERIMSIILEEDSDVIRWIKPPLNQLGLFWQPGQQYTPDFLVETSTSKYMVEVKAENEAASADVLSKAREGIKWCFYASTADPDHKAWQYRLITDNNVSAGNTCKYTLGTALKISEV